MDPRRARGGRRPTVTGPIDPVVIRRARADDAIGIGDVWLSSWRATFAFPPGHPDDDVRRWLATELVPRHETWVAADPGGRRRGPDGPVGHDGRAAVRGTRSDRTGAGASVARPCQGRVGPAGLELFCFQVNASARRFYERNGFSAIAFGATAPATRSASRTSVYRVEPGAAGGMTLDTTPSRSVASRTARRSRSSRSGPWPQPLILRPRDRGRPHDLPGRRADARRPSRGPRHRPPRSRRLGRHAAVRDRARVRGRRRGGRHASRRSRAARSTSSGTRTAGGRALGAALRTDLDPIGSCRTKERPTPAGSRYHPRRHRARALARLADGGSTSRRCSPRSS